MKTIRFFALIIAGLTGLFALTGCDSADGAFSVRHSVIDVGNASVGDSVKASFTFRNNTAESMTITFIPECDCTTVNKETMKLESRGCGQLEVKVKVENSGDFIKYIYVQASGHDEFITVAVKGRTK